MIKKIIISFIIIVSFLSCNQSETIKEPKTREKIPIERKIRAYCEGKNREFIYIGDYRFFRTNSSLISPINYGTIIYRLGSIYDDEEADKLKTHILKNKKYYEEYLNCSILDIYCKEHYTYSDLYLELTYNDWEELREIYIEQEKIEKQNRLKSIDW